MMPIINVFYQEINSSGLEKSGSSIRSMSRKGGMSNMKHLFERKDGAKENEAIIRAD